ncbi:MAG: metallophosphoesterase [Bacteroidetes bacterium]|nr:metallophosphoesterase [Bacteroidota bacterium]
MLKFFLKLIPVLFPLALTAQIMPPYSVYLIGDAGEDTTPGKALLMLKEELLSHPNSAVIFLGDNIYPSGLKDNDKKSAAHLESQLQILNKYKGSVYFIPGNHDWQAQGPKGLKRLSNEEKYVETYLKDKTISKNKNNSTFLPHDGLPGPETVLLKEKLRLIIIDTQWFLHYYKKNKIQSKKHTNELFYSHLDSLLNLAKQNGEQVIIATHHPMFTNGHHSSSKQPLRFLINKTPLQIFGLMGLNRLLSQDIQQPRYKKMRNRMLKSFNQYDNIICASGHDHNLQCFKEGANRYIVSGAGSKLNQFQKKKKFDSIFQDDTKTGFVKIQYAPDGKHITIVYRVGEKEKLIEGF